MEQEGGLRRLCQINSKIYNKTGPKLNLVNVTSKKQGLLCMQHSAQQPAAPAGRESDHCRQGPFITRALGVIGQSGSTSLHRCRPIRLMAPGSIEGERGPGGKDSQAHTA